MALELENAAEGGKSPLLALALVQLVHVVLAGNVVFDEMGRFLAAVPWEGAVSLSL